MAQQLAAIDATIRGIAIGKVFADIAERARAEQCIAERMQQYIAIRMRNDAARMRDTHTAERNEIAIAKTMHVITMTDTEYHQAVSIKRRLKMLVYKYSGNCCGASIRD
jgi:hypothetical protein